MMSATATTPAQGTISLFKLITVRDEIIIGLAADTLAALGGDDAGCVGRHLRAAGEWTVWQFSVRKGADGELELAPIRLVSVLAQESVRVEPYQTQLRILPPVK